MSKKRRRFVWLAVLGLVALLVWDGRVVAQLRFTGNAHVPSLDADFSRLPALLPAGECAVYQLYRGLVHPMHDSKEFTRELWTTANRSIHGYRFRWEQEKASQAFLNTVAEILASPASYGPYGGPKVCGGYHADFAVMLGGDGKERWLLVCFGCSEVLIYSDKGKLICELDRIAHFRLKEAWYEHVGRPFEQVTTRLPIPADSLGKWGLEEYARNYRKRTGTPNPTWSFGEAFLREQSIQSLAKNPDSGIALSFFTIREESLATEADASRRAGEVNDPPPSDHKPAEERKTFEKAFPLGRQVYVVSTRRQDLEAEVPRILELLRAHCEATLPAEVKQFE